MTLFLSVRSQDVGGPVVPAFCVESTGGAHPTYSAPLTGRQVAARVRGRELVVAVHGFNVNRPKGVRSYVTLERELGMPDDRRVFMGVLWPGDFIIPVINYPAEASDAVKSGRYVAEFLDAWCGGAVAVSFVSHSLGGRVLLEAVSAMAAPVKALCITAGAVDNDCLHGQYAAVKAKAGRISVLSSRKDKVLKFAYPLGDFGSDVLWGDDDSPWRGALGLKGPSPVEAEPKVWHRPIPKAPPLNYDHGDYFPPSDAAVPPTPPGPTPPGWRTSVAYMRRALEDAPDAWP
jgi:hypothetical protein